MVVDLRSRSATAILIVIALGLLALLLRPPGERSTSAVGTRAPPEARAEIRGGPLDPDIEGTAELRPFRDGTLLSLRVEGLPPFQPGTPPVGPHGFHVHEFGDCTVSDPDDPFQAAGGHYDPAGQPHPNHAGDLPVLYANDGFALMEVFTNRFRPADVTGRSLIIHQNPDDYRSQPAGDSGPRLACGVIQGVDA